jgi:PIN domain nuclease of toxin-antitoxin system
LLLDTNIVVRLRHDWRSLDSGTRRIIGNADGVWVSAASLWEIAIKAAARK